MKNTPLYETSCPIARSLGRIGDSWSVMILRDITAGFTRFDEFQKSCGIAPNILSRRLKDLIDDGLLEKVKYSLSPPRYEYQLTQKGKDFRPVLLALAVWGTEHFSPEGPQLQLVETETHRPLRTAMVDAATGEVVVPEAYSLVPGPAADPIIRYRHAYLSQKKAGVEPLKFTPPEKQG
ncbi:helix-turn-helix transcriptional regulator [Rahnella sp. SAP-1]|uniref:Helix-turn-helix transcriptional regulator n=1 Tax=Rouxiella aceris TaxID=2703884 RepID=A0A848MET8_9GAMM|nr:helix-turn-helix domain-containing protein [Rouxiella aceris]NMP25633.1 helix-turn-helix transcriptional regulator [Rouxiella aceris]